MPILDSVLQDESASGLCLAEHLNARAFNWTQDLRLNYCSGTDIVSPGDSYFGFLTFSRYTNSLKRKKKRKKCFRVCWLIRFSKPVVLGCMEFSKPSVGGLFRITGLAFLFGVS